MLAIGELEGAHAVQWWGETDLRLLLWEYIIFTMDVMPTVAGGEEICIAMHACWPAGFHADGQDQLS